MQTPSLQNLDRFEVIACYATNPVAVLSTTDLSNIELLDVSAGTGPGLNEEEKAHIQAKGLVFIAVVGVLSGKAEIATELPLPVDVSFAIGASYSRHLLSKSHGIPSNSDSLNFLNGLWSLQDPRPN